MGLGCDVCNALILKKTSPIYSGNPCPAVGYKEVADDTNLNEQIKINVYLIPTY